MIADLVIARYANGQITLTNWGYVTAFAIICWAVTVGVAISRRKP